MDLDEQLTEVQIEIQKTEEEINETKNKITKIEEEIQESKQEIRETKEELKDAKKIQKEISEKLKSLENDEQRQNKEKEYEQLMKKDSEMSETCRELRDKESKLIDNKTKLIDKETKLIDKENELIKTHRQFLAKQDEIMKEKKKNQEAETEEKFVEDPATITEMTTAFTRPFQGGDDLAGYVKRRLKEYIIKCAHYWKEENALNVHAPIGVITQSSGYGKSRMLYEISSELITTYICLRRTVGESGFPPRSSIGDWFEPSQISSEASARNLITFVIEKSLNNVKEILESKGYSIVPDKWEDVALEYRKGQEWLDSSKNVEKSKLPHINSDYNELRVEFNRVMNKSPLVIVIDEAHALFKTDNEHKSPFGLLRRALLNTFKQFRIAIILASTNSCIGKYELSPHQYSSSMRELNTNAMLPFTWLITTDCMAQEYFDQIQMLYDYHFESNAEKAKLAATKKPKLAAAKEPKQDSVYEWVMSRIPQKTFFRLGRPLWGSYFLSNLTQIALHKLLHPLTFSEQNKGIDAREFEKYMSNSLAVIGARVDFLIRFINPSYGTASELVDKCMATLVDLDNEIGQVTVRYVSEPILAHAAAVYMAEPEILEVILKTFTSYLDRNHTVLSVGEIGELVAQLILLIAKDKAAEQDKVEDVEMIDDEDDNEDAGAGQGNGQGDTQNIIDDTFYAHYARPVTVDQFLRSWLTEDNYQIVSSSISEKLKEGILCFNHFIKKIDNLSMHDLLFDFIGRSAAGAFKDNFPGLDLFLPIVFKQNEEKCVGLFGLQIKDIIQRLSDKEAKDIAEKADFKKIEELEELINHPKFDKENSIVFVMDLVEPKTKNDHKADTVLSQSKMPRSSYSVPTARVKSMNLGFNCFHIYGTTPYECLSDKIRPLIDNMINLPRDPLLKYSRFAQKGCFIGAQSYLTRGKIDLSTREISVLRGSAASSRRSLNAQLAKMVIERKATTNKSQQNKPKK